LRVQDLDDRIAAQAIHIRRVAAGNERIELHHLLVSSLVQVSMIDCAVALAGTLSP
jgi:hypothetical protein